jgi:hypothetical protein
LKQIKDQGSNPGLATLMERKNNKFLAAPLKEGKEREKF